MGSLTGDGARKPAPAVKPVDRDENIDERKNLDRAETIWRETTPLGPEAVGYSLSVELLSMRCPHTADCVFTRIAHGAKR
jgi:hypothetical protein